MHFLIQTANDYAIQQQKFQPGLGNDVQLLKEIAEWHDFPNFPLVERPSLPEPNPK
jgi:hypothetical protein